MAEKETGSGDRPMSWGERQEMWKKVYRAERDRFERERDDARFSARMAALEQERLNDRLREALDA